MIVVALVALACAYVAWNARIVRERKELLARLHAFGGKAETVEEARIWVEIGLYNYEFSEDETPTVSWIRRCFGDEPVVEMWIPMSMQPQDAAEISRAFAEAIISVTSLQKSRQQSTKTPPAAGGVVRMYCRVGMDSASVYGGPRSTPSISSMIASGNRLAARRASA